MLHRYLSKLAAALVSCALPLHASLAAEPLRVLVHSSFSLPKPLLAQFEAQSGIKLQIIKGGDAGEMLNKLILTRAQPIADVVYGIDNASVFKAQTAQVLDGTPVAIDYGFVTLNYDKAAIAKLGIALPKTLEELALPRYRDMLVVQNPATSSPGYAFLLATIAGMGEEKAFAWWASMRANGLKVAKGWSEAYYTDFTRGGGTRPLVVSYASSPAAEVFYSKEKITESPTAALFLKGGVFRQEELIARVKQATANASQATSAQAFIDFMRSPSVQEALQTSMWMYPVDAKTPRADVMRHAPEPASHDSLPAAAIADKGSQWISRWTQVVLK